MPKIVSIFFLILLISLGKAQAERYNSKKKFSFGFSFSPDYTYRTLKSNIDEIDFIDMRNETESARFGFTGGLTIKYQISKRLALETGLLYADRGDKMETDDADYVFPDEGDPYIPDKIKTVYHYYFLGVPIKGNIYLLDKRTRVFLSGGVSFDFFSGSKTKQIAYYNGKKDVKSFSEEGVDFNNINLMGLAGFGIEYRLSKNYELRFEPIVRYSFSSLTSYSDIQTHLYSVGANIVIYFQK